MLSLDIAQKPVSNEDTGLWAIILPKRGKPRMRLIPVRRTDEANGNLGDMRCQRRNSAPSSASRNASSPNKGRYFVSITSANILENGLADREYSQSRKTENFIVYKLTIRIKKMQDFVVLENGLAVKASDNTLSTWFMMYPNLKYILEWGDRSGRTWNGAVAYEDSIPVYVNHRWMYELVFDPDVSDEEIQSWETFPSDYVNVYRRPTFGSIVKEARRMEAKHPSGLYSVLGVEKVNHAIYLMWAWRILNSSATEEDVQMEFNRIDALLDLQASGAVMWAILHSSSLLVELK